MKRRFPLIAGCLGAAIAYSSVLYTIHDAYTYYSYVDSVTAGAANLDLAYQETFSHEFIRYTIVVLDPAMLVLNRFSVKPDTVANEMFNERLRVLTLAINFCVYYCAGYLMTLIFSVLKGKQRRFKISLRG